MTRRTHGRSEEHSAKTVRWDQETAEAAENGRATPNTADPMGTTVETGVLLETEPLGGPFGVTNNARIRP